MSIWEWLVNVLSVILFAILVYRLMQVVYSIPYRRRMLADVYTTITCYRDAAAAQLEQHRHGDCTLITTRSALQTFIAQSYDPCQTMAMMHRTIGLRLANNERGADTRFGDWFDVVSGDFTRHYALANLATDLGMLGTVAGGIFAFNHIDNAADPFAAFPSLALAMITTAAGLVIAIIVKIVLGRYGIWLNDVVSFASRTIEDLIDLHAQADPLPSLVLHANATDAIAPGADLGGVMKHG